MTRTSFDRRLGTESGSGVPRSRLDRKQVGATRAASVCCGRYGCETHGVEGRRSQLPHESHSEALAAPSFQFSGFLPSGEGAFLGYNGAQFHAVPLLNFTMNAKVQINKMSRSDATHKMHQVVSS